MAKKRRREQQHRNQQTVRRRSFSSTPAERFDPGFPMNLLRNSRVFYVVGAIIMVGGVALAFLLQSQDPDQAVPDFEPTATGTPGTPTATATPDGRTFSAPEQVAQTQFRDYRATVTTGKGDFTIELFGDDAPATVNSFVFLAQKDFYDGLTFHRLVDGFIAQAGDPTNDENDTRDAPGYTLPEEPNEVRNTEGTVAMAKAGDGAQFGSQFFINLKDNPSLDFDVTSGEKYYPFGRVTEGLDVVKSLVRGDSIENITIEYSEKEGVSEPAQFESPDQVVDGAANTYTATIATAKGDIVVNLFAEESPNTVNSFVFLAQEGFFDNTTFHRVVDSSIRVAQAGDPTGVQGDGFDGPGYLVNEEPNERKNTAGTLSMAKVSGATNFGSQWFINVEDNPSLDFDGEQPDKFYPFAEVIEGMDVAESLAQGDAITSITITATPK